MLSSWSDFVSSATEAVSKVSDQCIDAVRQTGILEELQGTSILSFSDDAADGTSQAKLAVDALMTPPAAWTGSAEEWSASVEAALADANTCAVSPLELKKDAERWAELMALVTQLMDSDGTPLTKGMADEGQRVVEVLDRTSVCYTPAADLVEFIQAHHDIHAVRSDVVPLFVSDENYWLCVGWRLSLYRLCREPTQLLNVMQTCSKLPAQLCAVPTTNSQSTESNTTAAHANTNGRHLADNSAYWQARQQLLVKAQETRAWLREMQERAKKEMELANGNVKLLDGLLQREEASSALAVSVYDSCKYHKVKLTRLMGEINAAPEAEVQGTVLDFEHGAVFRELVQCNEAVQAVLADYTQRREEVGSGGGSPKTSMSASSPRDEHQETSPVAPSKSTGVAPTSKSNSETPVLLSVVESLSAAGDEDDDESFEATLPWSIDE